MTPPRAKPRLAQENRDFWTGGAVGELRIARCGDCSTFIHPPQVLCRCCRSENVHGHAVAGTGIIDTFTVNHQPWRPGLPVPYIIARVALDDAPGVILTTNIVNCAIDEVAIGDRVRVVFEEQDGIFYPLFEKAA